MSSEDEDESERFDDVSHGAIADPVWSVSLAIPEPILEKFEVYSYRSAAAILSRSFPEQFTEICDVLSSFRIA